VRHRGPGAAPGKPGASFLITTSGMVHANQANRRNVGQTLGIVELHSPRPPKSRCSGSGTDATTAEAVDCKSTIPGMWRFRATSVCGAPPGIVDSRRPAGRRPAQTQRACPRFPGVRRLRDRRSPCAQQAAHFSASIPQHTHGAASRSRPPKGTRDGPALTET
jgi:hypothetical protein